jgi:hypothetical protein
MEDKDLSPDDRVWVEILLRLKEYKRLSDHDIWEKLSLDNFPSDVIEMYLQKRKEYGE